MKLKKPTSLFKCWLRNRNFTQKTLDTRCQIKSPMWPNRTWHLGGGVNRTDDLPSNRQVRFTPNHLYDLPPPFKSSNFEQNFKRTQHHALLHKGLFCERPINWRFLFFQQWSPQIVTSAVHCTLHARQFNNIHTNIVREPEKATFSCF